MWKLPRLAGFAALPAAIAALVLFIAPDPSAARGGKGFKLIDIRKAEEMSAVEEFEALQEEMDEENSKEIEPAFDCKKADFGKPRKRCLRVRFLRNYSVIDDRHALFYESARRVFLVTFAVSCRELRWSFGIRAFSRNGDLCGYAGERIFVGRGAFRERCYIRSVERVESKEHGRCLVAERLAERERRRNGDDEIEEDGSEEEDDYGEEDGSEEEDDYGEEEP